MGPQLKPKSVWQQNSCSKLFIIQSFPFYYALGHQNQWEDMNYWTSVSEGWVCAWGESGQLETQKLLTEGQMENLLAFNSIILWEFS